MVARKLDLIRFSEVSRKLHSLARPKVFEVITIKALAYDRSMATSNPLRVEELYLKPFPSSFGGGHGPVRFMKSMRVAIEASQRRNDCCLHRNFRDVSESSSSYSSDSDDDNQTEHRPPPPDDIEAYVSEVLALLRFLEPGSLSSFQ